MTCPHCNGPLKTVRFLVYCEKSGQLVFPCSACETLNQSLARYCRNCGRENDFSVHSLNIENLYLPDLLLEPKPITGALYRETAETALSEDIETLSGFIWVVTHQGSIYRISPRATALEEWDKLPGNGFLLPFALEVNKERELVLYACNRQAVYEYKLITKDSGPALYDTSGDQSEEICSGIAKLKANIYFLVRRQKELILKCIGQNQWEQALGPLDLLESRHPPVFVADDSIWVVTVQKVFIFPNGLNASRPVEELWTCWQALPTRKGVWYSQKQEGGGGQTLFSLSFEEHGISRYRVEYLPLTAKLEVDQSTGQIAVFLPDSINVYSPTAKLLWDDARGKVDNHNPRAILFCSEPPLVVWFDATDQVVYRWKIGQADVQTLWRPREGIHFSRFYLAYGVLLGIDGGKVWRWDLLDN
jgi:hypothetical protein